MLRGACLAVACLAVACLVVACLGKKREKRGLVSVKKPKLLKDCVILDKRHTHLWRVCENERKSKKVFGNS